MLQTMLNHPFVRVTLRELGLEIYEVCFTLFKLMIPVLIVVKALEEMGAIPVISSLLEPLMQLQTLEQAMLQHKLQIHKLQQHKQNQMQKHKKL